MSAEIVWLSDKKLPKGLESAQAIRFQETLDHWDLIVLDFASFKSLSNEQRSKIIQNLDAHQTRTLHSKILVYLSRDDHDQVLYELSSKLQIFLIDSQEAEDLKDKVRTEFETVQGLKMDHRSLTLSQDLQTRLTKLNLELQERLQKRQEFLIASRKKAHQTEKRLETLKESMIAIGQSHTLLELESNLFKTLGPILNLESLRLLKFPQDKIYQEQLNRSHRPHLGLPIFTFDRPAGTLFLHRKEQIEFLKEETEFVSRLSETLSLALRRIDKFLESSILKEQWQATFNSLTTPFALIRMNYDVVECNPAFRKFPSPNGKCYELFFGRTSPCEGCRIGQSFQISNLNRQFEVLGQKIKFLTEEQTSIHIYYDVSESRQLTQTLLESTKVREMGSITSSIAHELNNPLGGILSFLYLIKEDLPPDSPLHADLKEMEKAVDKSREIVKNLLEFVRRGPK